MSSDASISVRPGQPSDAAAIAMFMIRLALETEQLKLNPSVVEQGVKAVLADAVKGQYYVATADTQIVGCLMITHEWSDWRNGDVWWIQSVYVSEDYRRNGVFRTLHAHVRAAAIEAGAAAIRLYVERHNDRAKQTYARLGLELTHYEVMAQDLPR